MTHLLRAELVKLRTTTAWWLFSLAVVLSTVVFLVVNAVSAHSLLLPLEQYVDVASHGHAANIPPEFLARITSEWQLGHSAVTQAATLYTSGQLVNVLLVCLLGIVLVTSEYYQQTATTTFLITPRRSRVVLAKLVTAVLLAGLAWLVSTVVSLVVGSVFLHQEGYGTQLGHPGVLRAIALNLAAYAIWAVFGVGVGALVRHQLAATVGVTVLYLAGTGASGLFELLREYVIQHDWILTAQVLLPPIASAVMISPTKTFDQSPGQWVGAAVLVAYGILMGIIGVTMLRRRDVT